MKEVTCCPFPELFSTQNGGLSESDMVVTVDFEEK